MNRNLESELRDLGADMGETLSPELWRYQFPPIIIKPESFSAQLGHIEGELREVRAAHKENDMVAIVEELMDVIHAAETALRMLDVAPLTLNRTKEKVVAKNLDRNYYGKVPERRTFLIEVWDTTPATADTVSDALMDWYPSHSVKPLTDGQFDCAKQAADAYSKVVPNA